MRKIKAKPFRPPRRFKPGKTDVEVVYCYPIEATLFNQRRFEEHQWQRAKERMWARLRGKTIEPEENYFAEVTR